MRNISEFFEFLSNCDKETLHTELMEQYNRLIHKNGIKSIKGSGSRKLIDS
jgi:hypothetical protein